VINKLQGSKAIYHDIEIAKNIKGFKTKAGRVNVVLGTCSKGEYIVTRDNKYGSGMISVLHESNSILVTDNSCTGIIEEESVKIIKFNCLYTKDQIDLFNKGK